MIVQEALAKLIDGLSSALTLEAIPPELLHGLGDLQALARALLQGPAPRESLLNLHKLTPTRPEGPWPQEGKALAALASVLSSGPELTRLLLRRPERVQLLLDFRLGRAWSLEELSAALTRSLEGCPDDFDRFAQRLTAFRNDQYVRLAACEFGLGSLEQVGLELSNLADLCLDRALSFVGDQLTRSHGSPIFEEDGAPRPCGLAAVAMGKYGAQELNFCSDIDVVFLYHSDEGHAGPLSLHEFFAKVCQQVTRLLSEPNAEGFCFRVDLRLRPEGSRGPICNSLAGAERYYETWGGPYDRLAWLKARPAAGDLGLGQQMVQLLKPFVFPRSIRPEVVEQIQELNLRLKSQQGQHHTAAGWNVKLGHGGIREVEFFVQALQLLHAGKQEILQERATLRALDKLLFTGLISEQEHRQLGESYEFWRHIEHRLQLHDGHQTHLLPDEGRLQVALHLGFSLPRFEEEMAQRRSQVAAIYATLTPTSIEAQEELRFAPLLDVELPVEFAVQILAAAGFAQADRATEQVRLLLSKPWGPLGRSRAGASSRLALALLSELANSPDPDAALLHFVELTLRFGPYAGFWELLERNRPLLRLLCSVFGSSDYLARQYLRYPELLDQLLLEGEARCWRDPEELRGELESRSREVDPDDVEGRLNLLHRFRTEEVLRIGSCDIAGDLTLERVWEALSNLADAVLEQIYPLALRNTEERYGVPRGPSGEPATMAVIGLGKLGGRELTYASDLDLIFIYSHRGSTDGAHPVDNGEFFARVTQRLIRSLSAALEEGSLYQVDTRLRPSGQQGTLVSSFEAFQEYHRLAQIWERQVLIKSRLVAGDAALGERVVRWIRTFVFSGADEGESLRQEIHRLRQRMEKELAEEKPGFYNLKLGRGGLLDVDFIVQYLQLFHGNAAAGLRVSSSLEALTALEEAKLLDEKTATTLTRGYRFLRRIESRLRLVRDRSAEHLPAEAQGLEIMARRLGYRQQLGATAGEQLLRDYLEETESLRGIYEEIFAVADDPSSK